MNILICNDDGIEAPGIEALYKVACEFGTVTVAAPDGERSAAGHAITIGKPIRTRRIEKDGKFFGTAIDGTPADCVKLALNALMDKPADLVLSGINLGSNTGISTIYSGTVAAAREGVVHNIPSIAFSSCSYQTPHFETSARVARKVLEQVAEHGLPGHTLLNVNIPGVPVEKLKGIRAASMGQSRWIEKFHARKDPFGNDYYWLDGEQEILDDGENVDINLVANNIAAVTPIQLNLTDSDQLSAISHWNFSTP
ncbi:5'/3'-nucleotidase SurE [Verrucomicrobiota bacterium]